MGDQTDDEAATIYFEVLDDNDENIPVRWSAEVTQEYILSKIASYMEDPKVNTLLSICNDISSNTEDMNQLSEKYMNLTKVIKNMYREHELFLHRMGNGTRIKFRDQGTQVDFPWLPDRILNPVPKLNGPSINSIPNTKTLVANPLAKKTPKPAGPVECIDLSSDEEKEASKSTENKQKKPAPVSSPVKTVQLITHPAPLPSTLLNDRSPYDIPPKPIVTLSETGTGGIVVQWDMPPEARKFKVTNFEIYAYQEKPNVPISSLLWEKIGFVVSLNLPMSCTLTQFVHGFRYHFAVRAVANNNNFGHFSNPVSHVYKKK